MMAASRALYNDMAATIKRHVEGHPERANRLNILESLVRDLCSDLKRDNRYFKRDLFMDACGFVGHKPFGD